MAKINAGSYSVHIGDLSTTGLEKLLSGKDFGQSKKFVLVDENSLKFCFPHLIASCPSLKDAEVVELESGEHNKNINICVGVWEALAELEAERGDVIINLGGGVIGDLGGFVASTFKRGMPFINIPTTLLAQVDASIGGKTGVDLNHLKNLIGVINDPLGVYIDEMFLRTLHTDQLTSGLAEIFKHGLVADKEYWDKCAGVSFESVSAFFDLVPNSIQIKNEIVQEDPFEKGKRKLLNFGHTIGHAVEAYSLESEYKSLLHGEAIGIGMICEAHLSLQKKMLTKEELEEITNVLLPRYPKFVMNEMTYHRLIEFMRNDKKNQGGHINFTLLECIGKGSFGHSADVQEIEKALNYYQKLIAEGA